MSFTKLPNKSEDTERAKLRTLAKTFGWHHHAGDPELIHGAFEGKEYSIAVDQKFMEVDVLVYKSSSHSQLTASIVKEDFETKAGKVMAAILQKLGTKYYSDIKTGDSFLDTNYHFHVNVQNREKLEALTSNPEAVSLLKDLLSYFEQIIFEPTGISCLKLIDTGDLDLNIVKEKLSKVKRLDALDGIYS